MLWKQHTKKASSQDECQVNAVFVKSKTKEGGTCFSYDVMESICVAVQFTLDEETASYGWSYKGGCFEEGRIANYMPAVPGQEYTFDKLDFEVREVNPGMAESLGFSLAGLFGLLATLSILGAIVAAAIVAYKHVKASREANGGVELAHTGNGQKDLAPGQAGHHQLHDDQ